MTTTNKRSNNNPVSDKVFPDGNIPDLPGYFQQDGMNVLPSTDVTAQPGKRYLGASRRAIRRVIAAEHRRTNKQANRAGNPRRGNKRNNNNRNRSRQ